ncbi:MAG: hypothetical protein LBH32_02790 [Dysgonamonadaceae bacterium]|jgi:hypothetical protein|nr:hypothetical protein [Dysgonamonadaceae bacterium]
MELKIYNSIIHGALQPQGEQPPVHYSEISHLLQEIPATLLEIETRLNQVFGRNSQVNFNADTPQNITQFLSNQNYTQVALDYFAPEITLPLPQAQTPFQRFYYFVITAEAQRIKLRLLQSVEILKDDICGKQEVKGVLALLARYAKNIREHTQPSPIFDFLLAQIVKLYFELTLIFDALLSETDYHSFSDFYYNRLNRQADESETAAYQKALHIHQAQRLYNDFDSAAAQSLLTQLFADLEKTPTDNTLIAVICALENAVFLQNTNQSLPAFEQIISVEFTNLIIKEQKGVLRQRYEREEIALDRANTIDEIITEISVKDIFKLKDNQAIAYNLLSYLNTQKEIYLKEPSALFKVVIEKQATELKKKPQPTIKPMQIKTKLAIANKHLAFLNGVNPKNNERYMPENDYKLLVAYVEYLIQNGSIPVITRKIPKCNIPKTWLKYTLYVIHSELYSSIQDVWIEFMQAVFDEFSPKIVEFSTLKTKFSVFPSGYNQRVKQVLG